MQDYCTWNIFCKIRLIFKSLMITLKKSGAPPVWIYVSYFALSYIISEVQTKAKSWQFREVHFHWRMCLAGGGDKPLAPRRKDWGYYFPLYKAGHHLTPLALCVGWRKKPEILCWDLSLELTEKCIHFILSTSPSMIPANEINGFVLASCWLNNEQQRFSHPYLAASGGTG